MNKFLKLICVAVISTFLAACGGGSDDTPEGSILGTCTETSNWNNLQIGMGTGPVKRYLGEPTSIETCSDCGNAIVYTYEVCRVFVVVDDKEKGTTKNVLIPGSVTFKNNYLSAIAAPKSPDGETLVREYTPAEVRAYRVSKGYR